ncbi:ATPase [Natronobacterium texcoconense]|uniref:Predicted P-loop ATPase/GTPase n=1 Tax=Natronobacterium texcoconense TaxID=1095778 RepID=A0A1H1G1P4_NATTX|nr:ATPase [Natronobacterium texcoconense]SDR07005.1 Predicted P-loop ATPase/GTPase [Natronobacterium texcoconense]
MLLLVVGADRVDAGKTTFSVGLLERTGAAGYKPRAGNDYWFDHDDCRRALADGRLYGKDAARLASAEERGRRPETLNPVHRLWRPAPGGGNGLLGRGDREFLVDRVGRPNGDPTYVRNATATVPDDVAEALPLEAAIPVATVEELNEVASRHHVPAFDALATEIEESEIAVVESYSDIAQPLTSLEPSTVTAVAAVEPGRATVYRGDRYCRACEIASSSPRDGSLEKRVADVLDYLDPFERVPLPPLGSNERSDPTTVADAYEDAYDALLSAAATVGSEPQA